MARENEKEGCPPYLRRRVDIEEEIRKRQERWRTKVHTPEAIKSAGREKQEEDQQPSTTTRTVHMESGEPPPPTRAATARKAEGEKLAEGPEVPRTQGRHAGTGGPILEAQTDRETARGVSDKPQVAISVPQPVIGESLPQTPRMRLVYQSDFTQPTGWDEGHSDKVKVFRLDGYYHIAVYDAKKWAYFNPPMILDNFKAQVDVELNSQSGKTADCGLVFCTEDANGMCFFYAFIISPRGFYCLYSQSEREVRIIIDWQSTEILKNGDTTNSLMIEKVEKR